MGTKANRIAFCAALVLGVRTAAAQQPPEPPSAPMSEHERLFAEGLAHYEGGRPVEAAIVWERLLADMGEARGWKLLYNLGLAYQAAAQASFAVERFEGFLRYVAQQQAALPPELEQRREDAATRLRAIQASHGGLGFADVGAGTVVRIDGAPPRRAGFVAWLTPGPHTVEIIGPTGRSKQGQVLVLAGQSAAIDTSDPAGPAPPPPPIVVPVPVRAPSEPPTFPTAIVLSGAGLTLVSFALPIGLGVRAADARDEAEALGSGHTGYADATREFESARTEYHVSYVLPAVLGVATITAATIGIVRIRSYEPEAALPQLSATLSPAGAVLSGAY